MSTMNCAQNGKSNEIYDSIRYLKKQIVIILIIFVYRKLKNYKTRNKLVLKMNQIICEEQFNSFASDFRF